MGGIGIVELFVLAFTLLVGAVVVVGLIAAVVMALRSANGPRHCPHCGKPLR